MAEVGGASVLDYNVFTYIDQVSIVSFTLMTVFSLYTNAGLYMRMDSPEKSVRCIVLSCTATRYSRWQPSSRVWIS